MIKKHSKTIAWFALMTFMTLAVFIASPSAGGGQPGSEGDPLVSRSYVDSRINQVIAMINGSGQQSQPAGGGVDAAALKREILSELAVDNGAAFTPVRAVKGQLILGGEGAEIILRSGRASGFCPGENGLVNATTGIEIFNGFEIPINHLILVPRDDGRGVAVTSDEAWFIIKGGYQALNPQG